MAMFSSMRRVKMTSFFEAQFFSDKWVITILCLMLIDDICRDCITPFEA